MFYFSALSFIIFHGVKKADGQLSELSEHQNISLENPLFAHCRPTKFCTKQHIC